MLMTRKPLILASGSPRRRAFLNELGLTFTVRTAEIDESVNHLESPEALVERLACEKAITVMKRFPASWVVAADTVVCLGETIFGKPADEAEAEKMMANLSGKTHTVWTGVCLGCHQEKTRESVIVQTGVRFIDLSPEMIRSYVATGEPLDKAGGYGIQGKGAWLVAEISGSYTNVVGLPLSQTVSLLLKYDIINPSLSSL